MSKSILKKLDKWAFFVALGLTTLAALLGFVVAILPAVEKAIGVLMVSLLTVLYSTQLKSFAKYCEYEFEAKVLDGILQSIESFTLFAVFGRTVVEPLIVSPVISDLFLFSFITGGLRIALKVMEDYGMKTKQKVTGIAFAIGLMTGYWYVLACVAHAPVALYDLTVASVPVVLLVMNLREIPAVKKLLERHSG
ncbi:hypothetical protein [Alicyclobacillus suci]|uniref:hypothetical protein n=1 Tax=Alicyclobacillus suci TaxID=2816080 RepID=UPI001A8FC62E|nr:hypothetical protein [Alicyclobacillus suci]